MYLISYDDIYVKNTGEKKDWRWFLFKFDHFVALTKNASDHLNVTAFFKRHTGKICATIAGESWRACEYLVTTTGLSMHYQPKDT